MDETDILASLTKKEKGIIINIRNEGEVITSDLMGIKMMTRENYDNSVCLITLVKYTRSLKDTNSLNSHQKKLMT